MVFLFRKLVLPKFDTVFVDRPPQPVHACEENQMKTENYGGQDHVKTCQYVIQ